MNKTTEQAFDYCLDIAWKHYENFPVASFLVPKRIRKHIAAIYAFSRIADDYADEGNIPPNQRIALLNEWEEQFRLCCEGNVTHPVFIALQNTIQTFSLPPVLFYKLLRAFKMDVTHNRYSTWDELLAYCDHSANPIGRLLLLLFGYRDELQHNYSDAICTALQLTNFWQDLSIDLKRNRLYIPSEIYSNYNFRTDDFFQPVKADTLKQIVEEVVHRTEMLYDKGTQLLPTLRYPLRWEIKLTILGGKEILKKIKDLNYNTFTERPTLQKRDTIFLLFRTFFLYI